MKTIKDVMAHYKNSQTNAAAAIGCSQTLIWKLINNRVKGGISPDLANKIHLATEGEIAKWELRPDFFDPPST